MLTDLERRTIDRLHPAVSAPRETVKDADSDRDRGASGDTLPVVVIDSCHSTWLFDEPNHRFRRFVKGLDMERSVSTDWRCFDHLVLDEQSDAFVVVLDSSGTRILRSWRHKKGCDHCAGDATSEMSLGELHSAIAG